MRTQRGQGSVAIGDIMTMATRVDILDNYFAISVTAKYRAFSEIVRKLKGHKI